jgi:hypothetical protein
MKRFKLTVLLAVAMALCSAAPLIAGPVKLVAVNGSPLPAGSVTTNYQWDKATTKYVVKGLTPGETYYLFGYVVDIWAFPRDFLLATFTADANGYAKGSETYVFPFDYASIGGWDGYYVTDSSGSVVMAGR